MNLPRTRQFLADLDQCLAYFHENDLYAGLRFLNAVEETVRLIELSPKGGTPFPTNRFPGMRLRPVKKFRHYLIFFEPTENGVARVHRLIHSARDWTNLVSDYS